MLDMIYLRLFSQDPVTVSFAVFVALASVILVILRRKVFVQDIQHIQESQTNGPEPIKDSYYEANKFFRRKGKILHIILCIIPFAACFIHFLLARFIGNAWATWYYYGIFYLAAALIALLPLCDLNRITRKIFPPFTVVFAVAALLHTLIYPMAWSSALRNHSHKSYTESFIAMTEDMEKYYSLTEWKKIDIPALRDKFLPVVEQAEKTNDDGLLYAAACAYSYYFFDGHVRAVPNTEPFWRGVMLLSGNDYGFSMVQLDDGRFIAVCCDMETPAYEAGIHDGTEIVMWNGKPVAQAAAETECIYKYMTWPVKENEDFFRPVWLATRGINDPIDSAERILKLADIEPRISRFIRNDTGEIVEIADPRKIPMELMDILTVEDHTDKRSPAYVGFIADSGEYTEIEVKSLGYGMDRLEYTYLSLINYLRPNAYWLDTNLETIMINDDTAYMLRFIESSSILMDNLSYLTGKNPVIRRKLYKKLTELRAQGMKKLIIDVRHNEGGHAAMGNETASLFSKERFPMGMEASLIDGNFKLLQTDYVEADGSFSDLQVVLLTDAFCLSAGDYLVKALGKCPNVTVMGMTSSNCSCQTTGGASFLSRSICEVRYPVNWRYNPDGTRFIDTDDTRTCTLPLDVKIPLTFEAALTMTSLDEDVPDYQLEYAIEYLRNK